MVLIQIGRIADEMDGTAHGARAVDGALWAAQDLDAIDVEEARRGGSGAALVSFLY